jgi:hypothetical protein
MPLWISVWSLIDHPVAKAAIPACVFGEYLWIVDIERVQSVDPGAEPAVWLKFDGDLFAHEKDVYNFFLR